MRAANGVATNTYSFRFDDLRPVSRAAAPPLDVTAAAFHARVEAAWTPPFVRPVPTNYGICALPETDPRSFEDGCTGANTASADRDSGSGSLLFTGSVRNLPNGVRYRVAVRSVHADGASAWVASVPPLVMPIARPDEPTLISVRPFDRAITIRWERAAGGTPPEGYAVCLGSVSGYRFIQAIGARFETFRDECNGIISSGRREFQSSRRLIELPLGTTEFTFGAEHGLGNNQDWYALVSATHATDNSEWVGTTADGVLVNPEPPVGVPSEVEARSLDLGIAVSWTRPVTFVPPTDTGSRPDGYSLCVLPPTRTGTFDAECTEAAQTTLTFTPDVESHTLGATELAGAPLTNGTAYRVAVRSFRGADNFSAWIASVPATVMPMERPLVPTGLTLTPLSAAIDVAFSAAAGGTQPDSYEVCLLLTTETTADCSSGQRTTNIGLERTLLLDGNYGAGLTITNDIAYSVHVRAITTLFGVSPWSAAAMTTPRAGEPPAPPTNVRATTPGTLAIVVNWEAPTNRMPEDYRVCVLPAGGSSLFCGSGNTSDVGDPTTTLALRDGALGIADGAEFTVFVRSLHRDGNSAWAEAATTVTPVPTANSDASLTSMRVVGQPDDTRSPYTPSFNPEVTTYTADEIFPSYTSYLVFDVTTTQPGATVSVDYRNDPDATLARTEGLTAGFRNTVSLVVTAPDGITTRRYSIVVQLDPAPPRDDESRDNTLSALEFSDVALIPRLNPAATDYRAHVPLSVSSTALTYTAHEDATVVVQAAVTPTGTDNNIYALAAGDNEFEIIITSESGVAFTYSITITRSDTPPDPHITLALDKVRYVEGTDAEIVITAEAVPPPTSDLTVNVSADGGGFDSYREGGSDKTITIGANQMTGTVTFGIVDDSSVEDDTTDSFLGNPEAIVRAGTDGNTYTFAEHDFPFFQVADDDAFPDAPEVTGAAATESGLTVVWNEPANTGNAAVTSYRICLDTVENRVRNSRCDGGGEVTWTTDMDEGTAGDTEYRATVNATVGTAYFVGVAARNGNTRGTTDHGDYGLYEELNTPATVTPGMMLPAAPAAPVSVMTEGSNAQIDVTWQPGSGGGPVASFNICSGGTSFFADFDAFTTACENRESSVSFRTRGATVTSQPFFGAFAINGAPYYVGVRAAGAIENSAWVEAAGSPVTPMAVPPNAPITAVAARGGTNDEVDVTWVAAPTGGMAEGLRFARQLL